MFRFLGTSAGSSTQEYGVIAPIVRKAAAWEAGTSAGTQQHIAPNILIDFPPSIPDQAGTGGELS